MSEGPLDAVVRPDWVRLGGDLAARVVEVAFRGTHTDYVVAMEAGELGIRVGGPPALARGATVGCTADRIFEDVATGDRIWFDDGKIGGIVERRERDRLHVRITRTPGREPEVGHLRSVVGLVWRSVVVWMLLLALLTLARLLG